MVSDLIVRVERDSAAMGALGLRLTAVNARQHQREDLPGFGVCLIASDENPALRLGLRVALQVSERQRQPPPRRAVLREELDGLGIGGLRRGVLSLLPEEIAEVRVKSAPIELEIDAESQPAFALRPSARALEREPHEGSRDRIGRLASEDGGAGGGRSGRLTLL